MYQQNFSEMSEGQALYAIGCHPAVENGVLGIRLPNGTFVVASDVRPDCILTVPYEAAICTKYSKKGTCSTCGISVNLALNSQLALLKWPGTPVLCLECASKKPGLEEFLTWVRSNRRANAS